LATDEVTVLEWERPGLKPGYPHPAYRAKEIAGALAKAGWRSPLEPLANGVTSGPHGQALSLAGKRAIVEVVCEVTVLPTKPTVRGFDPDGVRIDWRVG
jgi:hypothetical protein